MAKRMPIFPLIDGGNTRMQPVWVRDVAAGEHMLACCWQAERRGRLVLPACVRAVCRLWPRHAAESCHHAVPVSFPLAFPPLLIIPACPPPPACAALAAAIMNSLKTYDSLGKTYHLAGPDVMTVAEQVGGWRVGWRLACDVSSGCRPGLCPGPLRLPCPAPHEVLTSHYHALPPCPRSAITGGLHLPDHP